MIYMIYMMLIQTYLNPGLLCFQGSVEPIPGFWRKCAGFSTKKKGARTVVLMAMERETVVLTYFGCGIEGQG